MKLNNIKHIYFDLDHTLWDFDRNSALTFETIFKEEKLDISLPQFLETYVPINNNYWKLYRDNKISKEDLRTGRLNDCFKCMSLDVAPQIINNLSNNYIKYLPTYNHLLEDTLEILDYLKGHYQLHIITNGFEEVQHTKLTNSGISDFFQTVTTSEEAGVKKPDMNIFLKALKKSMALPENSVMVGDNYEADILGAHSVGMKTIFFDYYGKKEPVQSAGIQKLNELKIYL
ncbi:noncanonical pyrimidine nucleotidase, YjjG family [Antarcticibacterium flavum]|uniref:Noncanonical pyrimidine nucleotidase, YjjG family n=1 Tax=Antarcticibacterium flavum TaxID=2058175 RepID=A0A5B7X0U2_9FLAO|nr:MULTISPECIES: YjjG family noncanonical pyrimidine nucleotidase [Antarcticibacterium]MCM4160460.1 noncanonical pyrimidine nucleotidase, YjjG family [Antarcticibacterium sp. W02-3]QCY69204.1 noncanonical pyrimidine nucleotidase, YjjG family [Antarcticibacterium flavum]